MSSAAANRLHSPLVTPRLTIPAGKLKGLRLERGLTRKQLADTSKVSEIRIAQIERAKKRAETVTVPTAQKLAMALGVTFQELTKVEYDDPEQ